MSDVLSRINQIFNAQLINLQSVIEPKESRKVFKQCLKELENRGLVRD